MLVDSMTRPSHPDMLTPREQEVLALLREGLTDPQIAERLNITLDGLTTGVAGCILCPYREL